MQSNTKKFLTGDLTETNKCKIPQKMDELMVHSTNAQLHTTNDQCVKGSNIAGRKTKILFLAEENGVDTQLSNAKLRAHNLEFENTTNVVSLKAKTYFHAVTDKLDYQVPNVGFQTASGQCIDVSKKALSRAAALFQDETFNSHCSNGEFKTANSQKGNVLNKGPSTAKTLFQDRDNKFDGLFMKEVMQRASDQQIDNSNKVPNVELFQEESHCFNEHVSNNGFKTASGQQIRVSSEALSKAKVLLHDEAETLARQSSGKLLNTNSEKMNSVNKTLQKENVLFQEESHCFKEQVSNNGFKTASGQQIRVSSEALSKAKVLLHDEAETLVRQSSGKLLSANSEKMNSVNKTLQKENVLFQEESHCFKEQVSNNGFKTASGQQIRVSSEALSKAKVLLHDENGTLVRQSSGKFLSANSEEINSVNKGLQKENMLFCEKSHCFKEQVSNNGFKTASGQQIRVSSKALSKAKVLLHDENETLVRQSSGKFLSANSEEINSVNKGLQKENMLFLEKSHCFKEQVSNNGFKTANGQQIRVSSEALSKAKVLLHDENETLVRQSSGKCLNANNEKINSVNKALPKENVLFQGESHYFEGQVIEDRFLTIGDQQINLSNKALLTTESLLRDKVDTFKKQILQDQTNTKFQSANGKQIHVSETALSKARILFKEESDCLEGHMISDEFQTANGQQINIFHEALSKAKVLIEDEAGPLKKQLLNDTGQSKIANKTQTEIDKKSKSNPTFSRSLQKRKINDIENNLELNRQRKSNQFKKLRFSYEFQNLKSTANDINIIKDRKDQSTMSSALHRRTLDCNDINGYINSVGRNIQNNGTTNNDSSLISYEIAASTAALLVDEGNINLRERCQSPLEGNKTGGMANIPSSPVIGGQFIPRKRKRTNSKKKIISTLRNKDNLKYIHKSTEQKNDSDNIDQWNKKENTCLTVKQDSTDTTIGRRNASVTNEYGDTQLMIDFINQSLTILEKRLQAASNQENQISLKQWNRPKPSVGKLYFYKESNVNKRVSWKEITNGHKPVQCTHEELIKRKLPPDILEITAYNALAYKFRCSDFYGQSIVQNNTDGIKLEDGAYLILDENGCAGLAELKRSFLASPGVDPNLLPTGWIENHYKWIVWKLASVDRTKFDSLVLPRMLTPSRMMMELKYRYDREIDRSQRSALRKIVEKDDVPSRRMVLCVSSIIENNDTIVSNGSPIQLKSSSKKLILTDGWYSIRASVDQAMNKYITVGKIKEGTKLLIYGAELLNCDEGYSPLEVPENVCLKLHTNSTRRVRWDSKLGYISPAGPICIKLRTILPNGGLIGKIKASISRVYPMLYHEKTSSGESIFRNARCEEKAVIAYEKKRRSMVEAFYAKAEKYFCAENGKNNLDIDTTDLNVYEANEDSEKKEFYSERELQQLESDRRVKQEKFRQKLESGLHESLPPPRQVTPLLKIRVVEEETNATLSIWSPSEDVIDILKEGNCISVCNVFPATKSRSNELQLTTSRGAVFHQLKVANTNYPQRTYTALCDINVTTFAPVYGEFDTVGVVVCITHEPRGMKNFEEVCLAYPHVDSQSSYLSILFWQGLSSYGYTEILTVGSFIACCNLEWRRSTSTNIPVAYCTERSTFTRCPRQNHLQQPFNDLRCQITDVSTYVDTCVTGYNKHFGTQRKSMLRRPNQGAQGSNPGNIPWCKDNNNINKQSGSCVPEELAKSDLINTRPAKSSDIQKRLEKLQYYGEPPSISPLILKNSSKRVSLEFQSPLRANDQ